jgi:uncharacterized membrane protein YqgA involved in biofilm formation
LSGVVLNILTVIAGTALGLLFGRLIPERFRQIVFYALGSCTIGFGAITTVSGYGELASTRVGSFAPLILVASLVVGSLTGEALRIEYRLEQLGAWMYAHLPKGKGVNRGQGVEKTAPAVPAASSEAAADPAAATSGTPAAPYVAAPGVASGTPAAPYVAASGTPHFADGFMTASLFFCVGAMTFLGSIQAGLGDPSTLYLKSLLDGISAIALTTALGVGVGFSTLTIAVVQGGIALFAAFLGDFFTPAIIGALNLTGGVMLIALGIEIVGIKKLRVANMLPALLVALALAVCFG